jgi:hypothetical protein
MMGSQKHFISVLNSHDDSGRVMGSGCIST